MRSVLIAGLLLLAAPPAWAMTLASSDFADGGMIPQAYHHTDCEGQNVSPELSWKKVPPATQSLVLTMIDMDAHPSLWSHWIVVDIPPGATQLPHGLAVLPKGARAIVGNFGDAAYDGPCPPQGSGTHHYRFTLWALPKAAALPAGAKATQIQATLSMMAIERASITGWVRR
jgi:Raf kinase inhibitor-like YbhB/YbcL family protein